MAVFWQKFTGDFAMMFWTMTIFVFIIPLLIFIFRGKNNIGWMVTASILVNIGMWIERYIVIIPTETRPHLLYELVKGSYRPTYVEWIITASLFAGLILLYAIFTRFFPIVPLWETAEEIKPEIPTRRRRFGDRRSRRSGED
jgi:molybdopterin-containing oxidoreductase family membrane subunit